MITFYQARQMVLERITPTTATEIIPLATALGRVLAQPVISTINVPNHDNSGMDGYGVRLNDLAPDSPTTLAVVGDIPAGSYRAIPLAAGEAVRIMTGAPIPPGCDCVVIQEVVTRDANRVTIPTGQKPRQNIRPAGEDIRAGETVFTPGTRINPAILGMLATLGTTSVEVFQPITVAVVSTGNEVIAPGTPLQPGQVYDSNRAGLSAALTTMGCRVLDLGTLPDDHATITAALRHGASAAHAIISSGGVSVGDFDLVKNSLSELGGIEFWKVAMKPGKPQAYGQIGTAQFFGLPGNPVSSLAVFLLIVRPALLKLMGRAPEPDHHLCLPLKGHIVKKHNRRDFYRGCVDYNSGEPFVTPTGPQGSGIMSSMARANSFIILPEEPVEVRDGELVDVWMINYE